MDANGIIQNCIDIFNRHETPLNPNVAITIEGNKFIAAELTKKKIIGTNKIKHVLLLRGLIETKEGTKSFSKCFFPAANDTITSCFGKAYSKDENIFYPVIVESCSRGRTVVSIVEYGFSLSSQKRFQHDLFFDDGDEKSNNYVNLIEFISFPVLLSTLLEASQNAKMIGNDKIISWKDVVLPDDYKTYVKNPLYPLIESFDNLPVSVRFILNTKYRNQKDKEKICAMILKDII